MAIGVAIGHFIPSSAGFVNHFQTGTEQTEKTRAFLALGTSLFRYSDCNLKHPNVGTSRRRKRITRRAAYRERMTEHRSVFHPAITGEMPPLAPSCEDYVNVVPALRAGHPGGLNLTRRTVSAPTTVADLMGDLAALHQHFVKGRVVVSGFCHSE
jgi:hypothetical protein